MLKLNSKKIKAILILTDSMTMLVAGNKLKEWLKARGTVSLKDGKVFAGRAWKSIDEFLDGK